MKELAFLGGLPAGLMAGADPKALMMLSPLLGGLKAGGVFGGGKGDKTGTGYTLPDMAPGGGIGGGRPEGQSFNEAFGSGFARDMGTAPTIAAAQQGPLATPSIDMPQMVEGPSVPQQGGGILGGIKNFMGSDDGKAALFRAGATMLGGGSLGDAMMTGANFMDQRKTARKMDERDARDFGLRERQVNIGERQGDERIGISRDALEQDWQKALMGDENAKARLAQEGYQFDKTLSFREAEALRDQGNRDRAHDLDERQFRDASARGWYSARKAGSGGGGPLSSDPIGEYTTEVEGTPAKSNWSLFNPFSWGAEDTPATQGYKSKVDVFPMPADPRQAVPGRTYQTANGPAMWNGSTFVR